MRSIFLLVVALLLPTGANANVYDVDLLISSNIKTSGTSSEPMDSIVLFLAALLHQSSSLLLAMR